MKAKSMLGSRGRLRPSGRQGSRTSGPRSQRATPYPAGSVGADFAKRDYIKYLVERYHRCRETEIMAGRLERLRYALIFKNIETRFKAPTYFIPQSRFPELVDYLQNRIDDTILGRKNNQHGTGNYKSFDEYITKHGDQ